MTTSWSGQDWALLLGGVTVFMTGIAGFITSMVTLMRVGAVAQKVDGMLADRDAANRAVGILQGRQAGDDASDQRAEGRRQERALSREATALAPQNGAPVPVADDRTAVAAERGAAANERIADAAETASENKQK